MKIPKIKRQNDNGELEYCIQKLWIKGKNLEDFINTYGGDYKTFNAAANAVFSDACSWRSYRSKLKKSRERLNKEEK